MNDSVTGQFYQARVTLPDGRFAERDTFTAGLYLVGASSLQLVATAPFATGGIFWASETVELPGVPISQPATVRVRVWETSAGSYEGAIASGRLYGEFATREPNNDLHLPYTGGVIPGQDIEPVPLDGIQPLTLIPEPSTLAMLAVAGAIFFISFRFRKVSDLCKEELTQRE